MRSPFITLMLLAMLLPTQLMAGVKEGVVSLDLCTDWMLLNYAAPGQVRAYSPYLYQFPNDRIRPDLPTHDGSLEAVLALQPAMVLTGEFNAMLLRQRLRQLAVRVEVLKHPQNLQAIDDYIRQIVRLINPDRQPQAANRAHRDYPPREQTLLLLGANGIGTGRGTLEHDVLTAAGWQNYLHQRGYLALDLEQLVIIPPDLIYSAAARGHSLANRFAAHPALVRKLDGRMRAQEVDWRWECPGPWTYQLIEELASW